MQRSSERPATNFLYPENSQGKHGYFRRAAHRLASAVRAVAARFSQSPGGILNCNGWEPWLYPDRETGEEKLIDELRPKVAAYGVQLRPE